MFIYIKELDWWPVGSLSSQKLTFFFFWIFSNYSIPLTCVATSEIWSRPTASHSNAEGSLQCLDEAAVALMHLQLVQHHGTIKEACRAPRGFQSERRTQRRWRLALKGTSWEKWEFKKKIVPNISYTPQKFNWFYKYLFCSFFCFQASQNNWVLRLRFSFWEKAHKKMSLYTTRNENKTLSFRMKEWKDQLCLAELHKISKHKVGATLLKVARRWNEKEDRWSTLPSEGCFVLTRDKAHSAAKRKKKPQSNLFCGSIEFPRQARGGGGTGVSTNIPSTLPLLPSGEGFYLLFSLGCWSTKLNLWKQIPVFCLCPFKQIWSLCRIFAAFTRIPKRRWTRCKLAAFSLRCVFFTV